MSETITLRTKRLRWSYENKPLTDREVGIINEYEKLEREFIAAQQKIDDLHIKRAEAEDEASALRVDVAQKDGELQRLKEAFQPIYYAIGSLSRKHDSVEFRQLCEDTTAFTKSLSTPSPSAVVPCVWSERDSHVYETSCGSIVSNDADNYAFKFCGFCSKQITYAPKGK